MLHTELLDFVDNKIFWT